ncbi:MAG: hypothetical protein WCH99_10150 [Verrucomicrobiota bacterium]
MKPNSALAEVVALNKTNYPLRGISKLPVSGMNPSATHSTFRSKASLEYLGNLYHAPEENSQSAGCSPCRTRILIWSRLKNSAVRRAGAAIVGFQKIAASLNQWLISAGLRRRTVSGPGSANQNGSASNPPAKFLQSVEPGQNIIVPLLQDSSADSKTVRSNHNSK